MKVKPKTGYLVASIASIALVLTACSAGSPAESPNSGAPADADWKPTSDIKMIVPFSVGGGSDLFARAVAAGLEEVRPGINVTVENREGGSGTIGYSYFLEQKGNPHFLLPTETGLISGPARNKELRYDWQTFTMLGMLVDDVNWIVSSSKSGWNNFDEFVAAAKKKSAAGDPLTVGLPSADGTEAVPTKSLLNQLGIDVEPVVFDGGGETIPALLSGDIDVMIANAGEIAGQVEAGDFIPLIGYGETTIDEGKYKGVPTTGTLGYDVDLDFGQFRGVIAPPDIPQAAQDYYIEALKEWTTKLAIKPWPFRWLLVR